MKNTKTIIFITIAIIAIFLFIFIVNQNYNFFKKNYTQNINLISPDWSSPENTLRTFWRAAKANDINTALKCVDKNKVESGRDARNVENYINEIAKIEDNDFQYISSDSRITIRSPFYSMDYDMEQQKNGDWVIISIHP